MEFNFNSVIVAGAALQQGGLLLKFDDFYGWGDIFFFLFGSVCLSLFHKSIVYS